MTIDDTTDLAVRVEREVLVRLEATNRWRWQYLDFVLDSFFVDHKPVLIFFFNRSRWGFRCGLFCIVFETFFFFTAANSQFEVITAGAIAHLVCTIYLKGWTLSKVFNQKKMTDNWRGQSRPQGFNAYTTADDPPLTPPNSWDTANGRSALQWVSTQGRFGLEVGTHRSCEGRHNTRTMQEVCKSVILLASVTTYFFNFCVARTDRALFFQGWNLFLCRWSCYRNTIWYRTPPGNSHRAVWHGQVFYISHSPPLLLHPVR